MASLVIPLRAVRRPLFLHFLDGPHFRAHSVDRYVTDRVVTEASLALRLAVVLGSDVMVPAAAYYENPVARRLLDLFRNTDYSDIFELVGTGASAAHFADAKLAQYPRHTREGTIYRRRLFQPFPWRRRSGSATADIEADWIRDLSDGTLVDELQLDTVARGSRQLVRDLQAVPERLQGRAFTAENVASVVPAIGSSPSARRHLVTVINDSYFASYLREIRAGIFQRLPWLSAGSYVRSPRPEHDVDFRSLVHLLRDVGLLREIMRASASSLRAMISDERFVKAFHYSQSAPAESAQPSHSTRSRKIDVVIVTALPEEKDAVLAVFGVAPKGETFPDDNHIYYIFRERVGRRFITLALAHPNQMGEAPASAMATDMLRTFDSGFVIVVGVAGGCPNPKSAADHVRLGDVVVADRIFKHDHVKLHESGEREYRDYPQPVGGRWNQSLSTCRVVGGKWDPEWRRFLATARKRARVARPNALLDVLRDSRGRRLQHPADPERRAASPRVFVGLVASGGTLLRNPVLRDELRDKWKTKAVEMESSGVRDAVIGKGKDLISVRGIMDYCDGRKADRWKPYSALAAAAFARMLIRRIPPGWL